MSNFNVLNTRHVMALSIIATEAALFNTISERAISFAHSLGLVLEDIDLLMREMKNAAGLVALAHVDEGLRGNPDFLKAVDAARVFAGTVALSHKVTEIAKERGLLFVNDDSELVYDTDGMTANYREIAAEAYRRVEDEVNANNTEDNEEEHEGPAEGQARHHQLFADP